MYVKYRERNELEKLEEKKGCKSNDFKVSSGEHESYNN